MALWSLHVPVYPTTQRVHQTVFPKDKPTTNNVLQYMYPFQEQQWDKRINGVKL